MAQDLNYRDPTYTASADYIGNIDSTLSVHHTRGAISTGLTYQLTHNVSLSMTPYVSESAFGNINWGDFVTLSGII